MRTAATLMSCVYQCISEVGRRWPEGNWYRETIVVQYLARDAGPHDAARRFHISGICFMPQAVSFIVPAQAIQHMPFASFHLFGGCIGAEVNHLLFRFQYCPERINGSFNNIGRALGGILYIPVVETAAVFYQFRIPSGISPHGASFTFQHYKGGAVSQDVSLAIGFARCCTERIGVVSYM